LNNHLSQFYLIYKNKTDKITYKLQKKSNNYNGIFFEIKINIKKNIIFV